MTSNQTEKKLTQAEQETLFEKNRNLQIAQNDFNSFMIFLRKQHNALGEKWQIKQDGTGFIQENTDK